MQGKAMGGLPVGLLELYHPLLEKPQTLTLFCRLPMKSKRRTPLLLGFVSISPLIPSYVFFELHHGHWDGCLTKLDFIYLLLLYMLYLHFSRTCIEILFSVAFFSSESVYMSYFEDLHIFAFNSMCFGRWRCGWECGRVSFCPQLSRHKAEYRSFS